MSVSNAASSPQPALPASARRRRRVLLFAIAALVGTTGALALFVAWASRDDGSVPNPDLTGLQPRVAKRLTEARRLVRKNPDSVQPWGYFGAVCDAHEIYTAAATCYRRCAELDPNDFRWPYLLAYVGELAGAPVEETAVLWRKAAELEPEFPPTFYRLGEALMTRGRVQEAAEAYRKAIELHPTLAIAHRGLGQCLIRLGDPEAALHHLQLALEHGTADLAVFAAMAQAHTRLGNEAAAQEAVEQSQGASIGLTLPDPVRYKVAALGISAQHCFKRGKDLLERGEYAAAIEQIEIALEHHPSEPVFLYELGNAYLGAGRYRLAGEHFSAAVRVREDFVDAHLALGSMLATQGRLDEAIGVYRRARTHAPKRPIVLLRLGTALARRGDLDEAIVLLEQAAAASPSDPQIQMNWGAALLDRGDLPEAIERFRAAIELLPGYALGHYNLGRALEELGRVDEAIIHYRSAVVIDPNNPARGELERLDAVP